MSTIELDHFNKAIFFVLDEAFDTVHGIFLDKGDSLFETLATISAAEASIPVGEKCATLAAQVKHVAFYLDVADRYVRDPSIPRVDWGEIWRTVKAVSPEEWESIQAELRVNYQRIKELIKSSPGWKDENEIAGVVGLIAHTAYHLGEIRQALCTLKS